MTGQWESKKLAELHSRTDRDLQILVGRSVDAAVRALSLGQYIRAAQLRDETARLLPLIYGLCDAERSHITRKLAGLEANRQSACAAC